MKTQAEIKHEYELTKAKRDECIQELNKAIDNLGRFHSGSRDNKIAWENFEAAQQEALYLSVRVGTLRFVLED